MGLFPIALVPQGPKVYAECNISIDPKGGCHVAEQIR